MHTQWNCHSLEGKLNNMHLCTQQFGGNCRKNTTKKTVQYKVNKDEHYMLSLTVTMNSLIDLLLLYGW